MLYIDGNGILRHCDDELVHYGVPGMKWGVRRYLNKNGQLTGMGRRRLRYDNAKYSDRDNKLAVKQDSLSKKKPSNRVNKKLDKIKAKRARYQEIMKLASSSLSAKDIRKGQKKYNGRNNLYKAYLYSQLFTNEVGSDERRRARLELRRLNR